VAAHGLHHRVAVLARRKAGADPTTTFASLIRVPRFLLARIASTIASGFSFFASVPSGSARTAILPSLTQPPGGVRVRGEPGGDVLDRCGALMIASEKQIVRRMDVGIRKSLITTEKPL
jgi:hypothetical protein